MRHVMKTENVHNPYRAAGNIRFFSLIVIKKDHFRVCVKMCGISISLEICLSHCQRKAQGLKALGENSALAQV